jgi:hypothetical protein
MENDFYDDKELFSLFMDTNLDIGEYETIRAFADIKMTIEDKILGIYPVIQLNLLKNIIRGFSISTLTYD